MLAFLDLSFEVRWFAGSLVRWFAGSLVRWFAGSLVRWFAGSLSKRGRGHTLIDGNNIARGEFKELCPTGDEGISAVSDETLVRRDAFNCFAALKDAIMITNPWGVWMAANKSLDEIKNQLVAALEPLEGSDKLFVITDERTGARYCECHVRGSKFVEFATPDAPLDPEEQGEYRANRDVVENAPAFMKMKSDAKERRSFSGIVAEYSHDTSAVKPVLIIGGQHRYHAIKEALDAGVDEWHGLKIYLDLTTEQRLDAQLISNTVIAISTDLFDRMHETVTGPQLRKWCQATGFLDEGEDFADRKSRGAITVQTARTFISSYYAGAELTSSNFDTKETTPPIALSGQHDASWDALKAAHPDLWEDAELKRAGQEFARLMLSQRAAFASKKPKPPVDYPEKATNMALLTAWAFVAGVLRTNATRLARHYALAGWSGHDPLNVGALVKGRHKSDTEQYRGLGYRTDAKERGRFAELFFLQAEDGTGINKNNVNIAIMKYHAKQAQLEVEKARAKVASANG